MISSSLRRDVRVEHDRAVQDLGRQVAQRGELVRGEAGGAQVVVRDGGQRLGRERVADAPRARGRGWPGPRGPASCWNTIARTSAPKCPSGRAAGATSGPARATRSASDGVARGRLLGGRAERRLRHRTAPAAAAPAAGRRGRRASGTPSRRRSSRWARPWARVPSARTTRCQGSPCLLGEDPPHQARRVAVDVAVGAHEPLGDGPTRSTIRALRASAAAITRRSRRRTCARRRSARTRAGVEEPLPLRSIARDVDVEQRLPEAGVLRRVDVDRDGAAVHRHAELLTGEVRGADVRAGADVPEAHRVGARAEVEGAPVEDPVDRPADRPAVRGRGGQDEQPHAREALGQLRRVRRRSGVWMRSRWAPAFA